MITNILRPTSEAIWDKMLEVIEEVIKRIPYVSLRCNDDFRCSDQLKKPSTESMKVKEEYVLKTVGNQTIVVPTEKKL